MGGLLSLFDDRPKQYASPKYPSTSSFSSQRASQSYRSTPSSTHNENPYRTTSANPWGSTYTPSYTSPSSSYLIQQQRVTPTQTGATTIYSHTSRAPTVSETQRSFHSLSLDIDQSPSRTSGDLSIRELETLMTRVDRLDRAKHFQPISWIYRDKPDAFFHKAFNEEGGIMKAYLKDHTGDQRSPINGKINGLFFATAQPPPTSSYFGSKRIKVPASFFMSKNAQSNSYRRVRLYFADFYCMSKMHWVTVVLTYEGTAVDRFCELRLPELDLNDNDFLYVDSCGSVMKRTSPNFKTEIFYTANVDLNHWTNRGGTIEPVNCLGQSSKFGKPKRSHCSICNL